MSPPPIGYPTRDVAGGDPVVAVVETKSKGDDDGCSWRQWYIYISVYFLHSYKKYYVYIYIYIDCVDFRDLFSQFCLDFKMFNTSDIFYRFHFNM